MSDITVGTIRAKVENNEILTNEDRAYIQYNAGSFDVSQETDAKIIGTLALSYDEFKQKLREKSVGGSMGGVTITDEVYDSFLSKVTQEELIEEYYNTTNYSSSIGDPPTPSARFDVSVNKTNEIFKKLVNDKKDEANSNIWNYVGTFFGGKEETPRSILKQPAKPPSEPDTEAEINEEETKNILDEKLVNAMQCYLLTYVKDIKASAPNKFSNRLTKINAKDNGTLTTFMNNLYLPKGHETLLWNTDSTPVLDAGVAVNSAELLYWDGTKHINVAEKVNSAGVAGGSKITNISVTFEGSNLTTARNEVAVSVDFTLNNLSILLDPNNVFINLITRPEFNNKLSNDNKELQFGAYYKKQWSPEYNRVVLKLFIKKKDNSFNHTVTLPLTMVQHTIDPYTGDGDDVKITLEYKGYVESTLNLPYMDVLGGKKVLEKG